LNNFDITNGIFLRRVLPYDSVRYLILLASTELYFCEFVTMSRVSQVVPPLAGWPTENDKLLCACARMPDDGKLISETFSRKGCWRGYLGLRGMR
jgi:hypothetical protein